MLSSPPIYSLVFCDNRKDGDDKARPVIIHRAILGSVERMIAILTENYAGKWWEACCCSFIYSLKTQMLTLPFFFLHNKCFFFLFTVSVFVLQSSKITWLLCWKDKQFTVLSVAQQFYTHQSLYAVISPRCWFCGGKNIDCSVFSL